LAWIGGFAVFFIGVAVAAVLLPKDHGRELELSPTGTEPAQTVANALDQVHLTAADRRAVNRTLVAFVRSGVTRDDPAAAWHLVTAAMRSSGTRKEWNAGELPVLPYPAQISDHPTWNVLTAFPGDVTIDLLLQPRRTSKRGPIAFAVELKRKSGRWLIDSMVPEQGFEPSEPEKVQQPGKVPNGVPPKGKLSPLWFIVPGMLLALIALVPIFVLLNSWRRSRAIERRYRAEQGL